MTRPQPTGDHRQTSVLEVHRDDPGVVRVAHPTLAPLEAGQVRAHIDGVAFSANNLTYATLGTSRGYWDTFPTSPPWGRIPAWGHVTVAQTANPAVPIGTHIYGLLPVADQVVLTPERQRGDRFLDAAAHRQPLAVVYRAYRRVPADRTGDAADRYALLAPVVILSFLLDEELAEHDCFNADAVALTSASAKAALALAFLLHRRGVTVWGITAQPKVRDVSRLGVYDGVVSYDHVVSALPAGRIAVVDLTGSASVVQAVHRAAGPRLVQIIQAGLTHGTRSPSGADQTLFFAPDRLVSRAHEWGPVELDRRTTAAIEAVRTWSAEWLHLSRAAGPEAVLQAYHRVRNGLVPLDVGMIMCPASQSRGGG